VSCLQGIYAVRSGDWKLIWGKVGVSDWVPDIDYAGGECTTLLPPVNSSGTLPSGPPTTRAPPPPPTGVAGPGAGLVCTEARPCLFNVIEDETEHKDPLVTAAANPTVVQRLQKELRTYVAKAYTGGLDTAKTSEDVYCEFVRREKWLRPFDDDPPPPPLPPAPSITPAAAKLASGTWAQGYRVPGEVGAAGPGQSIAGCFVWWLRLAGDVSCRQEGRADERAGTTMIIISPTHLTVADSFSARERRSRTARWQFVP
jgi:hypothetical protein